MFNTRILQLGNVADAEEEMRNIGVYPEGKAIMAPKAVHRVIKLERVGYREANILKQEMLACGGDAATSKGIVDFSTEESDILLMGSISQYNRLIAKLGGQPFKCPKIAEEIEVALKNYDRKEFLLKFQDKGMKIERTLVMGVLNVTPDSFSDGGLYHEPEAAIQRAKEMAMEGADIIDIGGESSRPFSQPISAEEEWGRVEPVIEGLANQLDIPISIDTYKPEVAKKALEAGASMINDITGLRKEEMMDVLLQYEVPAVIMHMKGEPRTMQENPQYKDVISEILKFFRERVQRAEERGITRDRMVIDPGIGFGKTVEHNLQILARLREFKSLGIPILIGSSRKSFIGKVLDVDVGQRLEGSLAAAAISIMNGANILRAHDVKETVRVARMADAILRQAV